jgi:ribosome-associated protein YbcJ (S4-like RNA binding protein)
MEEFKLIGEFITLSAFLKVKGYISSGGESKHFLLGNKILINKIIPGGRTSKIKKSDIVEINKIQYIIV